jgi:hypothetical protein
LIKIVICSYQMNFSHSEHGDPNEAGIFIRRQRQYDNSFREGKTF